MPELQDTVNTEPFRIGAILGGRFEIISLLGRGGMCTVFEARHLLMDRTISLKVPHGEMMTDKTGLQRFHREAVILSTLDHPNIVKIYGHGIESGLPYIAMELLTGESLADFLRQQKRLSQHTALQIFSQVLDGLAHAHEKGIVHRDLKPSNVMFDGPERVAKIIDFGIAGILPEFGKELQKLTRTGAVFGTLAYISPEQCRGERLDARSDIYSVGCMIYEALTGEPPFSGETPFAIMDRHLHDLPGRPPCLNSAFGQVILRSLAKDPLERPQSAVQLKAQLTRDASTKTEAYQLVGNSGSSSERKRLIAGAVILALGIMAIAYWQILKVNDSNKPFKTVRNIHRIKQTKTHRYHRHGISFDYPEDLSIDKAEFRQPLIAEDLPGTHVLGGKDNFHLNLYVYETKHPEKTQAAFLQLQKLANWIFLDEEPVHISENLSATRVCYNGNLKDRKGEYEEVYIIQKTGWIHVITFAAPTTTLYKSQEQEHRTILNSVRLD